MRLSDAERRRPRQCRGDRDLPVSLVTERLRCCGAENVILLLDACRNEGVRYGEGVGSETQPGVVAISSCRPNERSYEIDELKHGAFTYTLLEGLRLEGESQLCDGRTARPIFAFSCSGIVPALQETAPNPIHPDRADRKTSSDLLPKHASLADIAPLRVDALQAETKGDLETAEQLWWRGHRRSPAHAQAHEAVKRIALKQAEAEARSLPPEISAPPPPPEHRGAVQ